MAGLAVAGLVAVAVWGLSAPAPVDARIVALVVVGALAALGPLTQARQRDPVSLHWDGRRWHVGTPDAVEAARAPAGRLSVAMDWGGWMLLRFAADAPVATERRPWAWLGTATVWVPLQRRGLDADWHAVRTTLYSPPPVVAVPGPSAGPSE